MFKVTTTGRRFRTGPFEVLLCEAHEEQAEDAFGRNGTFTISGEIYDVTIARIP